MLSLNISMLVCSEVTVGKVLGSKKGKNNIQGLKSYISTSNTGRVKYNNPASNCSKLKTGYSD